MTVLPHPLRQLTGGHRVHLAALRRSWDDAQELRVQLEEVHEAVMRAHDRQLSLLVAISTASEETGFGLGQRLVEHLALQFHRSLGTPLAVVRLPLQSVEWAELAAVRRCWELTPPAGLPGPSPDLLELVQGLGSLARSAQPGSRHLLEVEQVHQTGPLLGWFHASYDHPPRPWQPGATWKPRPQTALITGARGFLAPHLRRLLEGQGYQVFPAQREDLQDRQSVGRLLEAVRPERVFHLGAQSSVAASLRDQRSTLLGNVMSQRYLLEGLVGTGSRVLVVGSADEYGLADDLPLTEDSPLQPRSIYALSKVGQDLMGLQFAREHGVHVVRVRSFNHTGPGRREGFMESSFARQLAAIERGQQEPILRVGNLDVRRDFTDCRDAVRAYALLLEHGEPGQVYQVCSGVSHSAREILDLLLGLSPAAVEVCVDPERLRPADIPEMLGSYARLQAATGWTPRISLQTTLRELLDYWRQEL